jgi:hypothetical protein
MGVDRGEFWKEGGEKMAGATAWIDLDQQTENTEIIISVLIT